MSPDFSPRAMEWTASFLKYPPRFLGVNGMLMTQQRYREGIPTKVASWIEQAQLLDAAGISPGQYETAMLELANVTSTRPYSVDLITWLLHAAIERAK